MTDDERKIIEENNYEMAMHIPGLGLCALCRFAFTVGLLHGITEVSYKGRWCFPHAVDAYKSLLELSTKDLENKETPKNPDNEDWVKYKGAVEYSNFRRNDFDPRTMKSEKDYE